MADVGFRQICQTAECYQAARSYRENMSYRYRILNKCFHWEQFACEGFQSANPRPEHRTEHTVMTKMADGVDDLVREYLYKPYVEVAASLNGSHLPLDGAAAVDAANLKLVADYYHSCMGSEHAAYSARTFTELMEEVNRAFAKMDALLPGRENANISTYRPAADTSEPLDWHDRFMVRDAQINLAQHNIFPFAKFTVQPSYLDPNKMTVVVSPHTAKAVPRSFEFKYWTGVWKYYGGQLMNFLHEAHGPQISRIQNLREVPTNMTKLEELLLAIGYAPRKARLFKHHIKTLKMDELYAMAPTLILNETILFFPRHGNSTIDTVEVIFPEYFVQLHRVLAKTSRETVRSFMLWQAFLQTEPLWQMGWVDEWRNFTDYRWNEYTNLTRREKCMSRAQRHFGRIVDSFYVRKAYSPAVTPFVHSIVEQMRRQWRRMILTTEWMTDQGRNFTLAKMDSLKIAIGYSKAHGLMSPESLAGYYAGAEVRAGKETAAAWQDQSPSSTFSLRRPEKWTHLHDYFHLERWQTNQTWARLGKKPPGPDDWPIAAHSQEPHYSPQHNQLYLPAATFRLPIFSLGAPDWLNYGGVGTIIASAMARAIDGDGQQYHANGSMAGETWPPKDWKKYSSKLKCFRWRWSNSRWEPAPRHGDGWFNTRDAVMADVDGMDVAFRAWALRQVEQTTLPGLEMFASYELFWVARTQPHCGVSHYGTYTPWIKENGQRPPFWLRVEEPLRDFPGFKESFHCGCSRCVLKFCKVFGKRLSIHEYAHENELPARG